MCDVPRCSSRDVTASYHFHRVILNSRPANGARRLFFFAWLIIVFGVLLLVKLQSGIPRNVSSIESTFEFFTHAMMERRDLPLF